MRERYCCVCHADLARIVVRNREGFEPRLNQYSLDLIRDGVMTYTTRCIVNRLL
jgi:hypothetical protein